MNDLNFQDMANDEPRLFPEPSETRISNGQFGNCDEATDNASTTGQFASMPIAHSKQTFIASPNY